MSSPNDNPLTPPDGPLDVLAVFAHPDDAELLCGATLVKCADKGLKTGVLDLTRGEAGSVGTPELRAEEAHAAAQVMGLSVRRNARLPDSRLENTHEARSHLASIFRELRPRVVVTHWTQGRHRDHRIAAELVYDSAFLAGLKNFDATGSAFRPSQVVHAVSFREDTPAPSFVVDVTEQLDRKLEAVACYGSQFHGKTSAGEIFPGGHRGLERQIRAHAAHWGSTIRCAWGEPFWVREMVEMDTLATLTTVTF